MANVLICDLFEASAYLVRSLLRGRGHAVSIATSAAEAAAKLETGLFDTLVVDLYTADDAAKAVVSHAQDLLPGLPVVGLTAEGNDSSLGGLGLFARFGRPIKGADVNRTVDRAVAHALGLGARRSSPRIDVDLPVTVELEDGKLEARLSDLSKRGFAIDAGADANLLTSTAGTLLDGSNKLRVTFSPKGVGAFTVTGRVAFVDRSRKAGNRMIGVVFETLGEGGQEWLASQFAVPEEAEVEQTA